MEVDGGDIVDQQLLQQFSCMGTTDKDELIRQFQKLIGVSLSTNVARFFLDMNNWNLQAAIGSYFDADSRPKLPSMSLVRDDSSCDSLNLPPSTVVDKVWTLMNNGEDSWPAGCHLQFTGGDILSNEERISVDSILPKHTTNVTVQLIAPQVPGMYKSKWRMVTPSGSYFGDIIWIIMTVIELGTSELVHQLAHLNTIGGSPQFQIPDTSNIGNPFGTQHRSIYQEHQKHDGSNKC